jgi:membrane protease YdiL (CAAX protease family)
LAKYVKASLWSLLYLVTYHIVQGATVVAVALAFSGALKRALYWGVYGQGGRDMPQAALADIQAAIARFTEENIGAILAVAALICLLALALIVEAKQWGFLPVSMLGNRPAPLDLLAGAACGASFSFLLSTALSYFLRSPLFPESPMDDYTSMMDELYGGDPMLVLLAVGVLVPIVEETLFRGVICNEFGRAFFAPPVPQAGQAAAGAAAAAGEGAAAGKRAPRPRCAREWRWSGNPFGGGVPVAAPARAAPNAPAPAAGAAPAPPMRFTPNRAGAVIVIQAFLFGAAHLNLVQFLFGVPVGLLFGYMMYKTRTVWTTVAAHVAANAFGVALMLFPAAGAFVLEESRFAALAALSCVALVLSARYFLKRGHGVPRAPG